MVLVGCLAAGVILASDVFRSGSNIETLLFGSLLLVDRSDIAAGRRRRHPRWGWPPCWSASAGWRAGFDPGAARSLGAGSGCSTCSCWA